MSPTPRCLGTVSLVALLVAAPAASQTAPGYVLNPPGGDTTRQRGEYGMSHLSEKRRRTPTGFLYPEPLEPQTLSVLGDGWLGRGSIDVGGMTAFGDTDEARFSRYADWNNEFLLDSFEVGVLHPGSGFHLDARGGAVGRDDPYYSGEIGLLSRFRVRGSWSGIPRDYARDARNLFEGAGSEVLRLPAPLVPGGTPVPPGQDPDVPVEDALLGIQESRLSMQRDELGLRLDARLLPELRLFATYRRQARKGERPFGGSLVYATGFTQQLARSVETTQPLDDVTHNLSAGLEFGRDGFLGRITYRVSFYHNDDDSLTWDNPFRISPIPIRGSQNVERGRFALAPDNSWNNVTGDFVARLPLDGVFTTTVSWSYARQNDDLLAFTVNSGQVGFGPNAVDLGDWNDEADLTRRRADAAVATLLVNGQLRLRPWRSLRLGARIRWYDRDDRTRYTAENANGDIGYIAEDGALNVGTPTFNRVFTGQGDDWRYRSTPYGYDQLLAEGTADYALRPKTSLGLRFRWERMGYEHRERDHTAESRIRVHLSSREISFATARLSYEFRSRTGDSYDPNPNEGDYVSSLDDNDNILPRSILPGLEKSDLSDRRQHLAELKLNFLLREDMDLALLARFRDDDYDATYGLRGDRRANASVEWSYQPSPRWGVSLFATYERGRRHMKTVNAELDGSFLPQNTWSERTREKTVATGVNGWLTILERVTLETNYSFILTRSRLDHDYASDGALSLGITGALAGSRFPTLRTEDHVLVTSLRFEIQEHVALRVFHLFQSGRIDDFQQVGLETGVIGGAYYLGHVDRDYDAHVIGGTVQLRF